MRLRFKCWFKTLESGEPVIMEVTSASALGPWHDLVGPAPRHHHVAPLFSTRTRS